MQINSVSGIIYPDIKDDLSAVASQVDLNSGSSLYGELSNANSNTLSSDAGMSSSDDGNALINTTNDQYQETDTQKLAAGFKNVLFDGSDSASASDLKTKNIDQTKIINNTKVVSDTSIDRTNDVRLEEDISRKLEDYRRQILDWKKKKGNSNLADSFGLDMNGGVKKEKTRNYQKQESSSNYKSFKDIQNIIKTNKQTNGKSDGQDGNLRETFNIDSKSQTDGGRDAFSRYEKDDGRGDLKNRSKKLGNNKNKLNFAKSNKKDGKKRRSEKGDREDNRSTAKLVKDITKTSLETSSGMIVSVLGALWGLVSGLFSQDILFRLILGVVLGVSFVAVVLVGS
ncbi:magnesium transporter [Candidatus Woesebacteria bacterium]|nr:magnesium transporter [Candidatus Woesebacteria bacterium]